MNKLGTWLYKNVYNVVLFIIGVLNVLPVLAPIFACLNVNFLARAIYYLYSLFCHQLHWRSLHVCDHQYGWCTRCTFIWFNILLTGILVKVFHIRKVNWYWLGVFFLPIALDGIIQTIATMVGLTTISSIYYMSNNFIRMFTGSMFGIGFGLFIWQNLLDSEGYENLKVLEKKKELNVLKLTITLIFLSFALYFLAVVIWDQTSIIYKPENIFDFAVKTPPLANDFLIRGINGSE
jgi:uncharacterized membrane protein